jgi:hypothetical protein
MGAIGISEFTFGYAFLYEQTHANWAGLRAAPVLPSLQQEHDQGWDAHLPLIGADFYYQFKLSEYLSRHNAKFIADGTYDEPYYRLSLHRKDGNRQHQRLRQHALVNPNTYYVAPEFNPVDNFNAAYLARQITARSRLIPLSDCDDIADGDQHYITFRTGDSGWLQHSQSKRHEGSIAGAELSSLYLQRKDQWRPIDLQFATHVFEKTRDLVRAVLAKEDRSRVDKAVPLLDFSPGQATKGELLRRTSEVLSVTLGLTLVLVGSDDN